MSALGFLETAGQTLSPPFGKREIARVLAQTGNPGDFEIKRRSWRPFSSGVLITLAQGGALFIKKHPAAVRSKKSLERQHDFIRHILQRGIQTPRPLALASGKDKDGKTAHYELMTPLKTTDTYEKRPSWSAYRTPEEAKSAGQLLRRLHKAAEDFAPQAELSPADEFLTSSMTFLQQENFMTPLDRLASSHPLMQDIHPAYAKIRPELKRLLIPFMEKARNAGADKTPVLYGHGDWHGSNLGWRQGKAAEVFDFGMFNRTNAAFDVAVAIERSFIDWLNAAPQAAVMQIHENQLDAFLQGYAGDAPLSASFMKSVAALLPLCHIVFALSESGYYHDSGRRNGAAFVLDKYLLGHLNWFNSHNGRSLLQRLANRISGTPKS